MHGLEVSWIFVDKLFEIRPLLDDAYILGTRCAMVLLNKFIKLAV